MPDVTRIIEQTATESIFNDDWLIKDSPTNGTTKIQPSVLKAWINDGMATDEELETAVDDTIAKLSAVGSASGAIATFDDGNDLPMPSLKVAIEPQQEGSGEPSPTNIRPISGWDEVNATVVGKNIFGGLPLANAIVNAGGTIDTVNKTVSFNHGDSQYNILKNVKLKDNTKYTFILTYSNSGDNNSLSLYYTSSAFRYSINLNNSSNTKTTIIYTTTTAKIDRLVLSYYNASTTNIYYEESGLFEGELTASDFEAYNGQTYAIDLDGTRYGGTLDVVSGELTVTYAKIALADISKSKYGSYQYGIRTISNFFDSIPNSTLMTGMSNTFVLSVSGESYNVDKCSILFANGSSKTSFLISTQASGLSADASVTEINAWLRSIDAYFVYPLATPQTYQLTPTQVKSLLGVNNIWADTGDVLNAEYIRDMTTIINYLIARIDMLENQ